MTVALLSPAVISALFLLVSAFFLKDAILRVRFAPLQLRDLLIWLLLSMTALAGSLMAVDLPGLPPLMYSFAAFLALTLGYSRALLSMALVLAILTPWQNWGVTLLINAVLPVWLMCSVVALSRRLLPPNPFVFLLGCGFFGIFAVCAVQSITKLGVFWLLPSDGSITTLSDYGDHWLWAVLLAGGEATLEGMMITILVVYYPRAVYLFDDRFYLQPS